MEQSPEFKQRLQAIAKIGVLAVEAGGTGVKIFRKHGQNSWGYTYLSDSSILTIGAIIDGSPKPREMSGTLLNRSFHNVDGREPEIEWDEILDHTLVDDLEKYITPED